MTKEVAVIQDWLDKLHYEAKSLNKWEEDFLDSVREQFNNKKWISDRQEEILERIYAEKT